MTHRITALVVAALTLAVAGSSAAQGGPPPTELVIDRVVAVVGGTPITWNEVMERVNQLRQEGATIPPDSASQTAFARDVLDGLIDDELLVQRAKTEKVEVADADVSTQVDDQLKKIIAGYKSEDLFKAELQKTGFGTKEEFRHYLADNVRRGELIRKLVEKMKQDQKIPQVPVTDADVTAYFKEHEKEAQLLPATIAFKQIVIAPHASAAAKAAARAKAESLFNEIRTGGDFEALAKRWSMDPGTKDQGGDLGWQRRGELVPEFERWYFTLAPGSVSPVFESTFGFHIVRVDRVTPSEVKGRHILIVPKIDSAQIALQHRVADSVATALRNGGSFTALAKAYHDYAAKEQDVVPPFPRTQLPATYQKAFEGKKVGDVTAPFAIEDKTRGVDKLVVAQITEITQERKPSAADYRDQIRAQLSQQRAMRRFIDSLKKETFVAVKL